MHCRLSSAFGLSLFIIIGCGPSEPDTHDVSGTVTLDGSPVTTGKVVFDPVDGQGPSAEAKIENGRFETKLTAGEKRVTIRAPKETGKLDSYGVAEVEEAIPAKYNIETILKETITSEGPNTLKFDLSSK